MAKDRDRDGSETSAPSQSKRPALGHRDTGDSQHSDHSSQQHQHQHQHQHQQHQQSTHHHHHHHQHRVKSQQKHVVGGGTGRLHARVPSSKALHKHHPPSAKPLVRRQSSTSPDPADRAFPPVATTSAAPAASTSSAHHRRASSDLRLSGHGSSAANLKKSLSGGSLKRNRSLADVAKRGGGGGSGGGTKSSGGPPLKRSLSNPAVAKKAAKNQVHFALGIDPQDDDDGDDDDNDEWVDASSSASPYISRRGSVVSSGHPESKPESPAYSHNRSNHRPHNAEATEQQSPRAQQYSPHQGAHPRSPSQHDLLPPPTSKLLQRVHSQTAMPVISTESATGESASVAAQRLQQRMAATATSPDSAASVFSGEGGMTVAQRRGMPGSSGGGGGGGDITSRFVTTSSHGSSGTQAAAGSFYVPNPRMARQGDDDASAPNRTRSLAAMSELQKQAGLRAGYQRGGEPSSLTSEEEVGGVMGGSAAAGSASSRARASTGYMVPPAEKSRTQQKLNLQRASSTLEPNHHHQGPVASPLVGGAGYDTRDPRVGKLLERTGMEYLNVRRYQNSVARSLARLSQLSGADRSRRIPQPNGAGSGHAKRHSDYGGLGAGSRISQSFRDHADSRPGSSAAAVGGSSGSRQQQQQQSGPGGPRRAVSSIRANGAGSSLDTDDDGVRRLHGGGGGVASMGGEGLSGASLVDGEEDDGTVALLRNMWEKNMDLSASQE